MLILIILIVVISLGVIANIVNHFRLKHKHKYRK